MRQVELMAQFYSNWHLIDPTVTGVVFLEDKSDEFFWNALLQKYRPGYYKFMGHSKEDASITGGCEECLKFKPYFSDRFFTCIDSDMRFLMQEPEIDSNHYICQTYTYSWENHLCEAKSLQRRFERACPDIAQKFNFTIFLSQFARLVFKPLLYLMSCKRNDSSVFTIADFRACIPNQCKRIELENNGERIIKRISDSFLQLFSSDKTSILDYELESAICKKLGINEENAYLHVRGHNVYDLVLYIGWLLCKSYGVNFKKDVLDLMPDGDYWEMDFIQVDLDSF